MSLKQKTLSGLIWTFIQQFSVQLISFCITIILARILLPKEFGLLAMLSVFVAVGNSLLEGGLTSSLIRSSGLSQEDYSTVFFFNLGGSVVIYLLVFMMAPYISAFYHQDILTLILRVYALDFILNAFFGVQNARLTKEMNFKIQMVIQIPSVFIGGLLGVGLALNGFGVWSLVWMNLLQSFISTLLHWMYSGWLPSPVFSKRCFKQHFHFGYKMTLTGLLDILYRNIYVLIIGRYFSITQLGFYSRADSVSQLPVSNISAVINKVTYPMFATIVNDDLQLKRVYKKLMQQVLFWNAPVLIFLAVVAEPLFRLLLTSKWLPAVPYFQILCMAGVIYPLHAYNLNILKVKGRSDLILKLEMIKKVLCVVGIFSVVSFGIYGLLYFQLGFNFLGYYINSIYSSKLINYPVREQISDIFPILVISFLSGIFCYALDHFYLQYLLADTLRIVIDGLCFSLIYLGSSSLSKLSAIHDFKQLILKP
ncbi:lipopolysaccharide biosynthesis protein [Pedobacter sp.]|jgi:O-antigen/teichoic acid export membrane protein|uniref:lipopolysaccharide biosynthesis protein n=1 Tax=Pedobacter sp. TaxID=1411316 RepID=UPI002CE4BB89|nr:lipopolysaccharide biosynthesis protein [Pedobacter sp.]HWW39191.1 lipopolysaccharide biosynthesis protein [Pedobacter sp.]